MSDILCRTSRFNLSQVGADFINPCCFGQDFSEWLVAQLSAAGVKAAVICMEDFGWANEATLGKQHYLVCVGGNSDERPGDPDYGTWRVIVEKHRSLFERLTGANKDSSTDPLCARIIEILRVAGFEGITVEH